MTPSSLMLSCHHCGAAYQRPVLEAGQWAQCERCDHVLETYSVFTPRAWLAVIVATLLCFALANVPHRHTAHFRPVSSRIVF